MMTITDGQLAEWLREATSPRAVDAATVEADWFTLCQLVREAIPALVTEVRELQAAEQDTCRLCRWYEDPAPAVARIERLLEAGERLYEASIGMAAHVELVDEKEAAALRAAVDAYEQARSSDD